MSGKSYPQLAELADFSLSSQRKYGVVRALAVFSGNPMLQAAAQLPFLSTPSSVPHFKIRKVREGGSHALVVVNGFWSKGDHHTHDWEHGVERRYARSTIYHLDWEASLHPVPALDEMLSLRGMQARLQSVIANPVWNAISAWNRSMNAAETAGKHLAAAICSSQYRRYTLAGHSLGARVVHFTLKSLAKQQQQRIDDVYLLGGAVGGSAKDDACWRSALDAVSARIYNCYSTEDRILQCLYQGANLMISQPIGLAPINLQHPRLVNHDCTSFVAGHTDWKGQFGTVLQGLRPGGKAR